MWSTIIGHEGQIAQIARTLESGRLPNAWLFAGPRGVGKRRVAEAVAATLACTQTRLRGQTPCGACSGCQKTAAGSDPNRVKPFLFSDSSQAGALTKSPRTPHPDLFVLEPEAVGSALFSSPEGLQLISPSDDTDLWKRRKPSEVIKIDAVRDLQAMLQRHPLEAPVKLTIIDEADRMSESTANSLLKLIEEPPPSTHFIIISSTPQALLPTIRSRALRITFGPLAHEAIADALMRSGRVERPEALRIARLSGGSLGIALSIDADVIRETLNRFQILATSGSSADILQTAEEWSHRPPQDMRLLFDLLASFYRDCLRFCLAGEIGGLIHPEATIAAAAISAPGALRALEQIENTRRALETAANKQLMFEHLLFSLAR